MKEMPGQKNYYFLVYLCIHMIQTGEFYATETVGSSPRFCLVS